MRIRLWLLGGVRAELEDGQPLKISRRHLLVLVLSAMERTALTRERAQSLLWPDSPPERARHSLTQALYAVRQAANADPITGSLTLHADPRVLDVDAITFMEACRSGQWERALELYRGDFLAGVSLSETPQFEQWSAHVQARLRDSADDAVAHLISQAEKEWNVPALMRWSRRRYELLPRSASATSQYVRALVIAGDRQAAHQVLASLRVQRSQVNDDSERTSELAAQIEGAEQELAATYAEGLAKAAPRRRGQRTAIAVAGLAVVAAVAVARARRPETPPRIGSSVAILELGRLTGDSLLVNESRDLLIEALSRLRDVSVVTRDHQRASVSQQGATYWTVNLLAQRVGDSTELVVDLARRDSQPTVATHATCAPARMSACVAHASSAVLATLLGARSHDILAEAARTESSDVALLDFIAGEQAFQSGRYAEATDDFQRAVQADSGFVLANYRLSTAADWAQRGAVVQVAALRAQRGARQVSGEFQQLIAAQAAWRRDDADSAEALYSRLVVAYPDDIDAAYGLGEVRFHRNPDRGRSSVEARSAFERVVSLAPMHAEARLHLMRIASIARDTVAIDSLSRRLRTGDPVRDREPDGLRAFSIGTRREQEAWLASVRQLPTSLLFPLAERIGNTAGNFEGALAITGLMIAPGRPEQDRELGYYGRVLTLLTLGRVREADAVVRETGTVNSAFAMRGRAQIVAMPYVRLDEKGVPALLRSMEACCPDSITGLRALRFFLAGATAVRLGNVRLLEDELRQLRTLARGPVGPDHADYVRTLTAALALAHADTAAALGTLSVPLSNPWGLLLRGQLLAGQGQYLAALKSLGIFEQSYMGMWPLAVPSHLARAEVYRRMGREDEATRELRIARWLWRDADPEVRAQLR